MEQESIQTSDIEKAMLISDEYLSQVRSFGALGYSPERIANILGLSKKEKFALLLRISIPGDTYFQAYTNGKSIGEYNIDAELAKQAEKGDVAAIETLERRKNDRIELDLRKQLLGV